MIAGVRSQVAATCGVLAGLTFPAAATATFPGANGRIAYSRQGLDELTWTSRPDGSGRRRVLSHGAQPQFTADGRHFVYVRSDTDLARKQGIYIATADGSVRRPIITTDDRRIGNGAWSVLDVTVSPDATSVAFTAAAHVTDEPHHPDIVTFGRPSIYVASIDGGDLRLLVTDARQPTWSPDGTTIAYIANDRAVARVAPDGSGRRTVIAAAPRTWRSQPDFSPDGTKLVLTQLTRPFRRRGSQIAIVDLAAARLRLLPVAVTRYAADAVWSPDGSRIAYVTLDLWRPRPLRLFLVRPDGTGKRVAFRSRQSQIYHLAWQPRPDAER
jgi:Tol biopolymer transport system component